MIVMLRASRHNQIRKGTLNVENSGVEFCEYPFSGWEFVLCLQSVPGLETWSGCGLWLRRRVELRERVGRLVLYPESASPLRHGEPGNCLSGERLAVGW